MSKIFVVENLSRDLWNFFLEKSSVGNFEQCYEYGEVSRKVFPHTHVVRLACLRENQPVGILQGIYRTYFGIGVTLGVRYGPVVNSENDDSTRVIECLLRALENCAKKRRIIRARIIVPQIWGVDNVFYSLGYTMTGHLNEYVVNLENGVNGLWKSISHNKRRNIKKAMCSGVEVFESRSEKDLLTFYRMLQAAEKRAGFTSYPLSWFENLWKLFKPDSSKVFLAIWNKKAVSGVFTLMQGKTVFALAAGSYRDGWEVRPNDIMHWKIMEWACKSGYLRYHMGFVSDPLPSEGSPSWGIWRWKREWNGSLGKLQVFHKILLPRYRFVFKAGKFAESGLKRFRSLKSRIFYS